MSKRFLDPGSRGRHAGRNSAQMEGADATTVPAAAFEDSVGAPTDVSR
jgi:hypothetical protein